ncbi:type IV toxin-antitoxin system AbiEi family antitoxin [Paraburkholderia sp. J63]|uniref:type IV toxin-antitoxin system AbiEi family antitoxin n=1 Tax=Paraburkholderia sp. J63 TaxID=2805434 RepID=UPI002ABD5C14|nr:type IV toxin-antitoxin system AbiEi family antitoxin [Paraburkholderia sp. J63]
MPDRCRLGGEPAAAILTDCLKPATFTAYCTGEVPREWVAQARLRRDRDGNVEFLKSPIRFAALLREVSTAAAARSIPCAAVLNAPHPSKASSPAAAPLR